MNDKTKENKATNNRQNSKNRGNKFNPKSRNSGKYRKGSGSSESGDEQESTKMGKGTRTYGNDPMWYAYNEQMLTDSASLAFSNPLGSSVENPLPGSSWYGYDEENANFHLDDGVAIPGIMTFDFVPGPGVSRDATSPLNVAAKNIYSYVRHANSGHTNYESQDLMLYIVAMDSAYTFWANMVRAYGFMATYAQSNRYLARTLIEALGFDFNDFENRLADFRAYINLYAYKLGSICVPSKMSYISRHIWLVSHVWVDSVSKKSQMYAYVPYNFWELNEVGSTEGAVLQMKKWQSYPMQHTFEQTRTMGNALIGKILESEDMMIMSGDILKAFGAENLFTVSSIAEGFYLVPEYSEEVCMQIQNISAVGEPPDALKITSEVSTGILRYEPKARLHGLVTKPYLNVRKDNITPSDVMVATRCMAIPERTTQVGQLTYSDFDSLGSEFVAYYTIHYLAEQNNSMYHTFNVGYQVSEIKSSQIEDWQKLALLLPMLEKFDWHPYMYIKVEDSNTKEILNYGTAGDFDNYTTVTSYELSKMNETALLSQFACPTMGAYVLANRK